MDKWRHGPIFSRCEPIKIARLQNPGMAMMVFVFVFTPRVKIRPGGDRPVRSVKGQQKKRLYHNHRLAACYSKRSWFHQRFTRKCSHESYATKTRKFSHDDVLHHRKYLSNGLLEFERGCFCDAKSTQYQPSRTESRHNANFVVTDKAGIMTTLGFQWRSLKQTKTGSTPQAIKNIWPLDSHSTQWASQIECTLRKIIRLDFPAVWKCYAQTALKLR